MGDAPGHVLVAFLDGPFAGQTQQMPCEEEVAPRATIPAHGKVRVVGPLGTHERETYGTYVRTVSSTPPGGSFRVVVRWTYMWHGEAGLEPEWPDDPELFTV